jgi:hypothetical protein
LPIELAPDDSKPSRFPRYLLVVRQRVRGKGWPSIRGGFRPEVEINGRVTRVLAEQTAAVNPGRLGESVGYLSFEEMRYVDAALRIVLGL